ncbi:MAG: hypothetical protein D6795_03665, partial [Deltaproteobacteria bacterium]
IAMITMGLLLATAVSAAAGAPVSDEVRDLRKEVRYLKLIQTLELTPEQIEQLLPIVHEAVALRKRFEEEAKGKESEEIAFLQEMKGALIAGKDPSEELEKRRSEMREARKAMHAQLAEVIAPVETILTDAQKAALARRRPRGHHRGAFGPGPEGHPMRGRKQGIFRAIAFVRKAPQEAVEARIDAIVQAAAAQGGDAEALRAELNDAVASIRQAERKDVRAVARRTLESLSPEAREALGKLQTRGMRRLARILSDPLFEKALEERRSTPVSPTR